MTFSVTVVPGEGIGPEIATGTLEVLKASGADIDFNVLNTEMSDPNRFVDSVVESALTTNALLKGPLGTPLGGGFKSLNVSLRSRLELYANIRPVKELPGLGSKLIPAERHKGKIIDFLLVRENMEDLYIGQERMIAPGVVIGDKLMTVEGCERIIRASFELARQRQLDGDHRKVCCAHKANILKKTEGMLLSVFEKIAPEYPDVAASSLIVDNAAQQLILNPYDLEVIFMSNLHGDILSDEAAGIIGGLGLAGSGNIGSNHAMFEAVHGTAPDIAGKGIANPSSLMLSSVMMLSYLGDQESALRMLNGMYSVYEKGEVRTGDLARTTPHAASTKEFTDAVVSAILNGEQPQDERFQVAALPSYHLPSTVSTGMATPIITTGIEILAVNKNGSDISRESLEAVGFTCGLNVSLHSTTGKLCRVIFTPKEGRKISDHTLPLLLEHAYEQGINVRSIHQISSE